MAWAGRGGEFGVTAMCRDMAVTCDPLPDPGLGDAVPDGHHDACAINTGDIARFDHRAAQNFPVHGVETNDVIANKNFSGRRNGQRAGFGLQVQRIVAFAPGPDLVGFWEINVTERHIVVLGCGRRVVVSGEQKQPPGSCPGGQQFSLFWTEDRCPNPYDRAGRHRTGCRNPGVSASNHGASVRPDRGWR